MSSAERPMPPSLSATDTLGRKTPATAYACESLMLPEPSRSTTTALDAVASPQSVVALCVSATPGSVNDALTLSGVPTGTGSAGPLTAPTVGATFSTIGESAALGLGSNPVAPRYRATTGGVPLSAKAALIVARPAASSVAVCARPSIANSTTPLGTPNADSTVAVNVIASPSRANCGLAASVVAVGTGRATR